MMNIFALSLLLTSLITGTVLSPPSHNRESDVSEVIVKDGHRVVVVEYEKEADGHTKVLISPHHDANDVTTSNVAGTGEKENKNAVPEPEEGKPSAGPRELVCDAFGKCKHKLAHALGKTKEKAHEIEHHAKEAKDSVIGKAKETLEGFGSEKVLDTVPGGHTVRDSLGKAKDKAKEVAGDVIGIVKDGVKKTKDFDVGDSPRRMKEDIQRNVTVKVEEGKEQMVEKAKETAENVKKVGHKSLSEILSKLHELAFDVIWFIISPEKIDAVVGLIHMFGFSTAYGMCVWVTFVSSYILGRYLSRQQFGMVQSRIYPVYFRAMGYCVGAALFGHVVTQRNKIFLNMVEIFQGFSLLSALLMLLANMMWLEPKSTKIMFERMKIEKEEERGVPGAAIEGLVDAGGDTVARPTRREIAKRNDVLVMNEKLKKLNTYSSALNVSTLVVLTWHMAYMGQKLQGTR